MTNELSLSPTQDAETYAIIGAAMEVHRELGSGFLEAVYQEALAQELMDRDIFFDREVPIRVRYKKRLLSNHYRADFIVKDEIIVELKAQVSTGNVEIAQMLNYLKATGLKKGLLINFGKPSLDYHRFVL